MKLPACITLFFVLVSVAFSATIPKDTYSCQGGKNYCIDRCYRKLKNKFWHYGNKKQEIGNEYIQGVYCHYNVCQQGFDDFRNPERSRRTPAWHQCKEIITNDFSNYYGYPYTINDSEVDY